MALHLSWTSVIVGCISASLAGIFNNSDLYPRLWKESSANKETTGNQFQSHGSPGERKQRPFCLDGERIFKSFVITCIGASSISDAYPPLWKESPGRLADPTQRTGCGHESGDHLCISVDSWWAGEFDHVKSCSDNLDDLLKYLWAAHVSSLKIAHKNFHDRLKYYSKQEADFERSWALFVDYLAPPRFPTTLTRMYEFQKGLPTRMLASGDIAPFIKDFTGFQNTVLLALNFIRKVHEYTGTIVIITGPPKLPRTSSHLKIPIRSHLQISFVVRSIQSLSRESASVKVASCSAQWL
nr:protein LEG1 homolog isoform X10 [Equus asinus]